MIKGVVVGGEAVAARFNAMPDALQARLRVLVTKATIGVQRRAKEKLNGEVLNVRTGRLRRSITQRVTESAGKVEGIVGTNVEYAHAHEFGFQGNVTVKEHLRRLKASGRQAIVRAHSRNVNLPERSFLRSALRELEPEIIESLHDVVKELNRK